MIPSGDAAKIVDAISVLRSMEGEDKPLLGRRVVVYGGGNANLTPEISHTLTLGGSYSPSFVRGLRLSVDYYDIEISGAITTPDPGAAIDACFAGANLSATNPACLVIRRDPLTGGLNGDPATTPGLFLALSAGFWSAVCIVISGPFWTRGWPEWWGWWLNMPIWSQWPLK